MNILCKIGLHKWRKIVENKWRFSLGNYKCVDYHVCKRCYLIKTSYDKLAFWIEKVEKQGEELKKLGANI